MHKDTTVQLNAGENGLKYSGSHFSIKTNFNLCQSRDYKYQQCKYYFELTCRMRKPGNCALLRLMLTKWTRCVGYTLVISRWGQLNSSSSNIGREKQTAVKSWVSLTLTSIKACTHTEDVQYIPIKYDNTVGAQICVCYSKYLKSVNIHMY